jgi:5-methylcytosine-specific restriction endonuclease McrA
MIITAKELENSIYSNGEVVKVTSKQKEMVKSLYGMPTTPTNADIARLIGKNVHISWWKRFLQSSHNDFNGKAAERIKYLDDKEADRNERKKKRKEKKKLQRERKKSEKKANPQPRKPKIEKHEDFYLSQAWRAMRYRVLKNHGPICMLCNASRDTGQVMHVDHIKPRSKYPALELCYDNLQVLCADCNLGKSNKDETDFRSK